MHKSSPSWTIPARQRHKAKEPTPGPGEYVINPMDPIKFPISTSLRTNIQAEKDSPGPGSYSPAVSASSPKIR